jgi:tetratricopeptide (TPR) repeat protein
MIKAIRQFSVGRGLWRTLGSLVLAGLVVAASSPPSSQEPAAPSTPRDFFNAGTQKLREGKLREAEAFFESALASQSERLQAPLLYNLGHVRFGQGIEELKKGPAAAPTAARGRAAAARADEASRAADEALAGDDVQKMVAAYLRGRGVRKEMKAATKVVQRALETHGTALNKWQRSSGDFKSDFELNRPDADARQNAETVDRCIARLIDTLRELQQTAMSMGEKNNQLGERLKQLKGRIPAPDMPPGGAGDDEDDEDQPNGPQPGQKEGPTKEGDEIYTLTPEQAAWLLEGFKLDSERRLPMGQKDSAEPKERSGRTW